MKRHVLLGQEIVEFFTHSVSSFTFDRSPYEPEAEPGRNLPLYSNLIYTGSFATKCGLFFKHKSFWQS